MCEKLKKGLIAAGTALVGIFAFLLGGLLRSSKDRTGETEADINRAENANSDAEAAASALQHTAGAVAGSTDNIEQCTDECLSIIENIEKRGTKSKD